MPARYAALMPALLISAAMLQPLVAQPQEVAMAKTDFEPLMGGCGGVYFVAEPGGLVVEVLKRDRNARNTITELRAILAGPDREVVAEAFIPDDGEPVGSGLGPPQTVRLTAQVDRPGIYALNITVSQDRYGQNLLWGFRTNCPRYLIETARGHRDVRHEEPIVLESPDRPAVVAFQPRLGELSIEVSGLPAGCPPPEVYDAAGALLGRLTPAAEGAVAWSAPAAEARDATPWELRLAMGQAVINADGLTRWEASDALPNACLWTLDPASWFPLIENRWLLTPYQRTVYGQPGDTGEVVLEVHNNATVERRFELALEFPGALWSAELAQSSVTVPGRQAVPVIVRYTVPDRADPSVCHVRVTPEDTPEVTTYSTLMARPGPAPATQPLAMPIQLRPYAHENEQFGYLPDYPLTYEPYFDPTGRPYLRTAAGIATWRDGWVETAIASAVTERPEVFADQAIGLTSTKLGFDADGDLYIPAICAGRNAILHSSDGGQTFAAYEVPGARGSIDIEQFSGHNLPQGPPPFVRFRRTASDPNLRWRSLNDLELFVPREVGGRIEIGEPILITRDCIGLSAHSGIPSTVVSRGSKVHVTWGEATDPQAEVPGVPTYVVTYDREAGVLGEPALLGYGPPANDVHNSPSITMDGDGYLHALIGTHGRPFQYCRSLVPNDAGGGWTEPELAGEGLGQTYIGFVCGPDNALYTVFRLWRSGEPYPNSSHATLALQRKLPGRPWEEPRILVVAPFSEYSVFYHRLTIDPAGRMFLSYDYWSTYWFYRNDHRGDRRALLMSPDGAATWKLAETSDLTAGVR